MWIKRTFEDNLSRSSSLLQGFPIWLLLGPRQVGKSSLFKKFLTKDRQEIQFDDLDTRTRAQQDIRLFSKELTLPLYIDEIQYVPQILSSLKLKVDQGKLSNGVIWLTGSQNFEVMKGVHESLAGRVAIIHLFGLTDEECPPENASPKSYFKRISQSNFPALHTIHKSEAIPLYLNSYISTYIERDVRELLGIQKRREFELFLKLCALRTGKLINYEDLARDARVSPSTIKDWLSLLEDSFLIKLVHPDFTNRSKRLIKTPKLYFLDAGLAAHLAGWTDSEILRLSPFAGSIFETHVFSNIYRSLTHQMKNFEITFYRDKDKNEIDFLLNIEHKTIPIEIKMGTPQASQLASIKKILTKNTDEKHGVVVSLSADLNKWNKITDEWTMIHPLDFSKWLNQKIYPSD